MEPGSLVANAYGSLNATERYYCQFGLADTYRGRLPETGLLVTATDADGDARVVERPGHPFFIATLFVPQAVATSAAPHPIIAAFLRAAAQR